MIGDDARRAVDEGAQGVVVSNHGGRQLDCVYPTLRALPEVVAAVNGQCEVLLDGGIRRGTDIVKALCMGARAVLIGRAYAYGLGAGGRAGVSRTIQILRADIDSRAQAARLSISLESSTSPTSPIRPSGAAARRSDPNTRTSSE